MSDYKHSIPDFSKLDPHMPIACVTSEFNYELSNALETENRELLRSQGFKNIECFSVPGALEIPAMVGRLLRNKRFGLILCFGVVIRGDTTHYDTVAEQSASGLMRLSLETDIPIINGILTCETQGQVEDRIGSQYALAGLKMMSEIEAKF